MVVRKEAIWRLRYLEGSFLQSSALTFFFLAEKNRYYTCAEVRYNPFIIANWESQNAETNLRHQQAPFGNGQVYLSREMAMASLLSKQMGPNGGSGTSDGEQVLVFVTAILTARKCKRRLRKVISISIWTFNWARLSQADMRVICVKKAMMGFKWWLRCNCVLVTSPNQEARFYHHHCTTGRAWNRSPWEWSWQIGLGRYALYLEDAR